MENQRLNKLFYLYIEKRASPEEKEELIQLISDKDNEEQVKNLFKEAWDNFEPGLGVFNSLQSRAILSKVLEHGPRPAEKKQQRIALWPRISIAAAILIFLSIGLYLGQNAENIPRAAKNQITESKHTIHPGSNRATLTLADGSKIMLDDASSGALSRQGNTQIIKTGSQIAYNAEALKGEILYNTITTPKGGQFKVILPDGTHVWLNAASSLRFPTAFTGNDRLVELTGEGYFEAAKDAKKPFKVKIKDGALVEVLGTHFNIMAYDDENSISTTLLEGSVRMHKGRISRILTPGQQARIPAGSEQINIIPADTTEATAWKNGFFQYNEADILTIMRQLSRWYNVEVVFTGTIPSGHYRGKVSRTADISEVLKILELSGINFTIKEGRKIIVNP